MTLDKYNGLFLGTSSDNTIILGKVLLPKETELTSALISLARIDNTDNPIWKSFNSDKNGYFKIKNLSYGTYKLLIFHSNYKQKVFPKIVLNNSTPKFVINTSLDPIK